MWMNLWAATWIPGLEFWYLFPIGVVVATLAMSTGVAGSNFWIPIYLLGLGLEPRLAFWASLTTLLFGFGSGLLRNVRAGTLDPPTIRRYLVFAAPAAAIGAVSSTRLPVRFLLFLFAIFLLFYAAWLARAALRELARGVDTEPTDSRLRWGRATLAGFLQGAIATGSGSLLLPCLLADRRLGRRGVAVGSTVALVFACSLISVIFRLDADLLATLRAEGPTLASMLVFAGPGAAVGGQLGPRLAHRLPRRVLRLYVAVVLAAVGVLVLVRVLG